VWDEWPWHAEEYCLEFPMNTLEKLQAIIDHCECEVIVSARENTTCYQSIEDFFETVCPNPSDDDGRVIKECMDTGIIYSIQAYPQTPIGSHVAYGTSLEAVVDRMFGWLPL
jgi:hypothetical protein